MGDLGELVLSCDRIEMLSINFAIRTDAHRRFDWSELAYGLIDPHSTLKTLRLDYDAPTSMEDLGLTNMYDFDESDFEEMGAMKDDYIMTVALRPVHDLQRKLRLAHLTLPENALCGTRSREDRWDSDGKYHDPDEYGPTVPRFAELLPPI